MPHSQKKHFIKKKERVNKKKKMSTKNLTNNVLKFWFGELSRSTPLVSTETEFSQKMKIWFEKDNKVDQEITEKFKEPLLDLTKDGSKWLNSVIPSFKEEKYGLVALVVLLDQFSRNIFRDSPKMYEFDPLALTTSLEAIRYYENDKEIPFIYKSFLYLPLMHTENLPLQQLMMQQFKQTKEESKLEFKDMNDEYYDQVLHFGKLHLDIVEQFGRFPHRNKILGRISTKEEEEFLKKPNSSF